MSGAACYLAFWIVLTGFAWRVAGPPPPYIAGMLIALVVLSVDALVREWIDYARRDR